MKKCNFGENLKTNLAALYIQQKVRGFLHLYNGQEAVLAGALHAMDLWKRQNDYCLS
jgi:pyruvate dehydrogenase E1 component alpha subunit